MSDKWQNEPPEGAVVLSQGWYWHYERTAEGRPIWRARLSGDPTSDVMRRHRVPSRAADRLRMRWAER